MPKDLEKSAQVVPLNPPQLPPPIPIIYPPYRTGLTDVERYKTARHIAETTYFNFLHGELALAQHEAAKEPKNPEAIERRTRAYERVAELRKDVYHWQKELDEAEARAQRGMREHSGTPREVIDKIGALYMHGMTAREIASRFAKSETTIKYLLQANGFRKHNKE